MNKYDKKYWTHENLIDPLIDFPVTGIVVKLSGGADSSIIYYTLCKELADHGIDIPVYAVTLNPETKDWYGHYAKKVINFTKERTGISPVEHRIRKLPLPWTVKEYQKEQDDVLFDLIRENLANVYYGGLTKNPLPTLQAKKASKVPGIVLDYNKCLTECEKHADPTRKTNLNKEAIGYGRPDNINVPKYLGILPFVHKDKKEGTAKLYKKMNVMEDLFPLTYSCEERRPSEKIKLNIVEGFQEYSHCGGCWFCLERAYAFGRLV